MAAARHPPEPDRERANQDELAFWDEWLQETRLALLSLVDRAHTLSSHGPAHPRRVQLGDLHAHLRAIEAAAGQAAQHVAQRARAEPPGDEDESPPPDRSRS